MISRDNKKNLRILRNIKFYLQSVEIAGGDAIDVADCLKFVNDWLVILDPKFNIHKATKKVKIK